MYLAQRCCTTLHFNMSTQHSLYEFAKGGEVEKHLTLRNAIIEYRDNRGLCWDKVETPELTIAHTSERISSMTKFDNCIGYPCKDVAIVLPPRVLDTPHQLLGILREWVSAALGAGRLWCPEGMVRVRRDKDGEWYSSSGVLPREVSECLSILDLRRYSPLSASTVHAAMEADIVDQSSVFSGVYPYPRNTTPSTGLLGTFHNNLAIDLAPFEKNKEPDLGSRAFRDEYLGYICAAHTSHTYEAGRSRRLACEVKMRMMTSKTLSSIAMLECRMPGATGPHVYTLYCNGLTCKITEAQFAKILGFHRVCSLTYDPGFSVHVSERHRMCFMNLSSGVLLKKASNGPWVDNLMMHVSDRVAGTLTPKLDVTGEDFKRACLSPFYSLIPYVEQNRAIRTTISSAQTIQAICLPWCPATAAVSPIYAFNPLVTTPLYSTIMSQRSDDDGDFASYLPGENMCILYHNLPLNYEDSVIVSSKYRDMGGFSTLSICKYTLSQSDYVPPVGSTLCSILSPWWKSRCQKHCQHTVKYLSQNKCTSPWYSPTGVLIDSYTLKTGEKVVKVRSFEQFQTGNKLSTGHGQKGVGTVVPYEDMPVVLMEDGSNVVPDLVMAMSSVIMRQTPGQLYETSSGTKALREGRDICVSENDKLPAMDTDFRVMDPFTGRTYSSIVRTESGDTVIRETRATMGYMRVFNQSQMTREKHFTSHKSPGKYSLRTPVKRTKGGGVAWGEMEVQACVAAGLPSCVEELRKRGDEILVQICVSCQRLRLLHSCTTDTEFVEVSLPYDTVVLDCVNRIVHDTTFKYGITPDV